MISAIAVMSDGTTSSLEENRRPVVKRKESHLKGSPKPMLVGLSVENIAAKTLTPDPSLKLAEAWN